MKLRQILKGYKPGDVCTGAVMRFGLQAMELARLGVIQDIGGQWCIARKDRERGKR